MKLNIIGNGFDLYHGLPSKYQDFAKWLTENDEVLFRNLGEYYEMQTYEFEQEGYNHDITGYKIDDVFWSAFEERLGKIKPQAFEFQLLDDLSLENDDPVNIGWQINADEIATALKNKFAEWVFEKVDQDYNYSIIKRLIKSNKCHLSKNDLYLNFNYTHSLQKIYNIPDKNIIYPHGECTRKNGYLIVGHGNKTDIVSLKAKIEKLKREYTYTQAERNRIDEKECELSFLQALKKDVEFVINMTTKDLELKNASINEIWVYGFSFGDVDLPYIKMINDLYPSATWHISSYSNDEENKKALEEKIKSYVKKDDIYISFFDFNNTNCQAIRDAIVNR